MPMNPNNVPSLCPKFQVHLAESTPMLQTHPTDGTPPPSSTVGRQTCRVPQNRTRNRTWDNQITGEHGLRLDPKNTVKTPWHESTNLLSPALPHTASVRGRLHGPKAHTVSLATHLPHINSCFSATSSSFCWSSCYRSPLAGIAVIPHSPWT